MTDEERKNLVPYSPEWNLRVGGSKLQVMGWSLYTLLLWLLKLCMNIFYGRLTYVVTLLPLQIRLADHSFREGLDGMQTRIKIGIVAVVATYIATILSILLGCRPLHKNWQIYPDPGSTSSFSRPTSKSSPLTESIILDHCQPAVSLIDLYVTVVLNVATDLYLMSIPLPVRPFAFHSDLKPIR